MNSGSHSGGPSAPVVVAIGGSDCSAGAGIQADIKTGGVFGVYVATVVTAVTAQNATGVLRVEAVSSAMFQSQLHALESGLPVSAIKLGMLAHPSQLEVLGEWLPKQQVPVVVDPVLFASSDGAALGLVDKLQVYREQILINTTLLTPNLQESARILDCPIADSYDDMVNQAKELLSLGPEAVLLKGGHLSSNKSTDVLVAAGLEVPLCCPRIASKHSHGGGCSLATAVAAGVASGLSLQQSCAAAKSFIQGAIANSGRLGLAENNGPLHQFYQYW